MRVRVILALVSAIILAPGPGGGTSPVEPLVEPLVVGWERIFTVSWESVERRGGTAVRGTVVNTSPHTIGDLQLLLDGLDGDGRIIAQQVAWTPGALPAFSQRPFEIAVRRPAPTYRVRVLAFTRLESPSFP